MLHALFLLLLTLPDEGHWTAIPKEEETWRGDGAHARFVAPDIRTSSAEVSVEIRCPEGAAGRAGLLLKVAVPDDGEKAEPGLTAYEISLEPSTGKLILGLHRRGQWMALQQIDAGVQAGRWHRLSVKMTSEGVLEACLDGQVVTRYENSEDPVAPGSIGLSVSTGSADFRHLKMVTKDGERTISPKEADKKDGQLRDSP